MKIDIPFEIGDKIWFINPKTMKATQSILKGLKVEIDTTESKTESKTILKGLDVHTKIKYHIGGTPLPNEQKLYVWNIFKTKEDLLKSL